MLDVKMNFPKGIKKGPMLIASIFSLVIIAAPLANFANANTPNIQDIQIKKVHVGDIDIAYKTFGKGDPILLISGYSFAMDSWDSILLETLASDHTVGFYMRH